MKIEFENKSYIEIYKVNDKVYISIAARDKDGRSLSIHSVDLSIEQFEKLINLK